MPDYGQWFCAGQTHFFAVMTYTTIQRSGAIHRHLPIATRRDLACKTQHER